MKYRFCVPSQEALTFRKSIVYKMANLRALQAVGGYSQMGQHLAYPVLYHSKK